MTRGPVGGNSLAAGPKEHVAATVRPGAQGYATHRGSLWLVSCSSLLGTYKRPVEFQRSRRKAPVDRPEGFGFIRTSSVDAVFREGSEIRELGMHLRHCRTQTSALPVPYSRAGFVLW